MAVAAITPTRPAVIPQHTHTAPPHPTLQAYLRQMQMARQGSVTSMGGGSSVAELSPHDMLAAQWVDGLDEGAALWQQEQQGFNSLAPVAASMRKVTEAGAGVGGGGGAGTHAHTHTLSHSHTHTHTHTHSCGRRM